MKILVTGANGYIGRHVTMQAKAVEISSKHIKELSCHMSQ